MSSPNVHFPSGTNNPPPRRHQKQDQRYRNIYEPELNLDQHREICNCCLGKYSEVWYQFKRFECLSLLNLYYYQHELVTLDKEIFGSQGDLRPKAWPTLNGEEWLKLRTLIKEYQTAIQLFKQTSQMKRPPMEHREDTLSTLRNKLRERHYERGHDAKGMLDLSPDALHMPHDSFRAFIEEFLPDEPGSFAPRNADDPDARHRAQRERGLAKVKRVPDKDQGEYNRKSLRMPVGPGADRVIRFAIGVLAAASLLVPLIVLSKIREREYTIMATCVFVLAFAFLVSMIGGGTTSEVSVAVATYSAVLVVFVGQTIAPLE